MMKIKKRFCTALKMTNFIKKCFYELQEIYFAINTVDNTVNEQDKILSASSHRET